MNNFGNPFYLTTNRNKLNHSCDANNLFALKSLADSKLRDALFTIINHGKDQKNYFTAVNFGMINTLD